jgi:hypothetical protein
MKKNLGIIDRIIRILVAVAIVVSLIDLQITIAASIVLIVLASVFVLTSLVGTCPLYLPFGIDTHQKK